MLRAAGETVTASCDPTVRLRMNGVLLERSGGLDSQLRFALDPVAEILAAAAHAEGCGADVNKWEIVISQSNSAPGFQAALKLALSFGEWTDSFLKNYSKPPIRAAKTHEANLRCLTHLKAAFAGRKLMELTADAIEQYLRDRLEQRVRVKFNGGYREKGALKSSTVHQEFRVLRRMLNIAVRKSCSQQTPVQGWNFRSR